MIPLCLNEKTSNKIKKLNKDLSFIRIYLFHERQNFPCILKFLKSALETINSFPKEYKEKTKMYTDEFVKLLEEIEKEEIENKIQVENEIQFEILVENDIQLDGSETAEKTVDLKNFKISKSFKKKLEESIDFFLNEYKNGVEIENRNGVEIENRNGVEIEYKNGVEIENRNGVESQLKRRNFILFLFIISLVITLGMCLKLANKKIQGNIINN